MLSVLCFLLLPIGFVSKAAGVPEDIPDIFWTSSYGDARYTEIMSSPASKYFIASQPDSAIVLKTVTDLTEDMLSPNYEKGVVDLPRLGSNYYYEISGSTAFYLSSGVYPSLCWTPAAQDTYCTLTIRSEADSSSLFSAVINLPTGMAGVDISEFKDCSSELTSYLVEHNDYYYYEMATQLYDAAAHKSSIIMPAYQIVPIDVKGEINDLNLSICNDVWKDNNIYVEKQSVSGNASPHNREVLSVGGKTTSSNIKDYAQFYQSPYLTPALLFQGNKSVDCTYDNNTGMAVTRTTASDNNDLFYFIAVNDRCYWGQVTTVPVNSDILTTVDGNVARLNWHTDNYESVLDLSEDIVSYDSWWSSSYVNGLTMRGKYNFSAKDPMSSKNIYATTLMFAGVDPHLATIDVTYPPRYTTISYYYMEPDSTSWTKLGADEKLLSSDVSIERLRKVPVIADFTATEWFTDTGLKTKVTIAALASDTRDTNIKLYAGYEYTGGTYTVTFYNDITGSKSTSMYEKRELPKLPTNPTPQAGYAFKCWRVVDSFDSVGGADYVPDKFMPEANSEYIFKTMWDIKGIITKVLTTKTRYYIGETVDKSMLQVYVQTNNDGDQIILKDDEYIMSGNTVSKNGTNQFTVTYTATGATGICEVTGLTDQLMSLTATYTGGSTAVGTEYNSGMFIVTENYMSGKVVNVDNFSFSPKTVSTIGENTVTITSATKSCTVKVIGIVDPTTQATMQKITASFVGTSPSVGDKVLPETFNVTAEYSDGTKRTLPKEEYTITPATYTTKGTFYVRVECNGLIANPSVNVTDPKQSTAPVSTPAPVVTPTPIATPTPVQSGSSSVSTSTSTNKPSASNSSSQNSGNSSNSSNGGSTTTQNKVEFGMASPLYIGGATIMTKTFGEANATPTENNVDIMQMLEDASKDAGSVTVQLTNGLSNNDITAAMLQILNDKKLTLYVEMMSPTNAKTLVGRWTVSGSTIGDVNVGFNPNIEFETVNKESDRVLKIDINAANYPTGTTLNVYPDVYTYGSGQTVRLYEVTAQGQVSSLKNVFTWLDTANRISVDVYSCYHYALSDSPTSYSLSDNLLEERIPDIVTATPAPTEDEPLLGGNQEELEWGWDWDDDGDIKQPAVVDKQKSAQLVMLLIGSGILLLFAVAIIVIAVTVSNKKKRKAVMPTESEIVEFENDDTVYDDSDDGYDSGNIDPPS